MPLTLPRAEIRDVIASISTYPVVIWEGDPEPMAGPSNGAPLGELFLDWKGSQTQGIDETRYEWDAAAGVNRSTTVGWRTGTLTIRADSYDFSKPALDEVERLRTRLRRQTTRDALREVNVALVACLPSVELDALADNRPLYRTVMDVTLAYLATEVDETAEGGIVETVNTTDIVPPSPPLTA